MFNSKGPDILNTSVHIDITPKKSIELIENLATSDEFREKFLENPQEILAEYGIQVAAEQIPPGVKLADKYDLKRVLACVLTAQDDAALGLLPYNMFGVFEFFAPPRKAAARGKTRKSKKMVLRKKRRSPKSRK